MTAGYPSGKLQRNEPVSDKDAMRTRKALSLEETLPLILSGAGALGVLPFTIIRFLNGEWGIGLLDAGIVACFLFLGIRVYRTGDVRGPSVLLALVGITGVVTTTYLKGPGQIDWAYPAIIALFYLLQPREALLVTTVAIVALLPPLMDSLSTIALTTVLVSLLLTASISYAFALLTRVQKQKLIKLATCDPLTNTGNRRALDEKLQKILAARKRNATQASLLVIDLDNFKGINDAYGHAAGDQILVSVTDIIKLRIRGTDSLYRVGGEEFVVLAEGQDIDRASQLAEHLRVLVEVNELSPQHNVSISIGVAELNDGETSEQWLCRADDALYDAKRAGKNTTSIADIA